jgi:hypothetical protein
MNKYVLIALYITLGVLTLLGSLQIIFLVVSDISVGALTSEPETGWGILFATFLTPPVAFLGAGAYIVRKKLKLQSVKIGKFDLAISSIAIIVAVANLTLSYTEEKRYQADLEAEQSARDAPINITRAEATELLKRCNIQLMQYGENS